MFEIQNLHFYNLWGVGRDVEDWKKQALDQISMSRNILSQQYHTTSSLYDINMSETAFVHDVTDSQKGVTFPERKILSSDQPHILSQNWTVYDSKYPMNWTRSRLPVIQRPEVAMESSPPSSYQRSRDAHFIASERDKHTNSLNEEVVHYMNEVVGDSEDRPAQVGAVVEMIGRKIQDVQGGLEMEKDVQRKGVGPSMERGYEYRFAKLKQRHFSPREQGQPTHSQPIHHKVVRNRRNASEQSLRAISFSEFQQRLHSVLSSHAKKYEDVIEKDTAKSLPVHSKRSRVWNPSIRRVSISEDLLQLQGVVIPASPSLEERGWPMWINTTELASHLPDLMEVVRQVEAEEEEHSVHNDVVKFSLNPDIVARGKVSIVAWTY